MASNDQKTDLLFREFTNTVNARQDVAFSNSQNKFPFKNFVMNKEIFSFDIPDSLSDISFTNAAGTTTYGCQALDFSFNNSSQPYGTTYSIPNTTLTFYYRFPLTKSLPSSIRTYHIPDTSFSSLISDTIPFNYDPSSKATYKHVLYPNNTSNVPVPIYYTPLYYLLDYKSGFVQFYGSDSAINSNINPANPPCLSFIRYTGSKGAGSGGGDSSFNNIDVSGNLNVKNLVVTESAKLPMDTSINSILYETDASYNRSGYPRIQEYAVANVRSSKINNGDWITIATCGRTLNTSFFKRADATFQLICDQVGPYQTINFRASHKEMQGNTIDILGHNWHGGILSLKELRIVYTDPSGGPVNEGGAVLQAKIGSTSTDWELQCRIMDNNDKYGWDLSFNTDASNNLLATNTPVNPATGTSFDAEILIDEDTLKWNPRNLLDHKSNIIFNSALKTKYTQIDDVAYLPKETLVLNKGIYNVSSDVSGYPLIHSFFQGDLNASDISNNWFTIAKNGETSGTGGIAGDAVFNLVTNQSGVRESLTFRATHKYGKGASINVLSHSGYNFGTITGLRMKYTKYPDVSGSRPYDGAVLQAKVGTLATPATIQLRIQDNNEPYGWDLSTNYSIVGTQKRIQPDSDPKVFVNDPLSSYYGSSYPSELLVDNLNWDPDTYFNNIIYTSPVRFDAPIDISKQLVVNGTNLYYKADTPFSNTDVVDYGTGLPATRNVTDDFVTIAYFIFDKNTYQRVSICCDFKITIYLRPTGTATHSLPLGYLSGKAFLYGYWRPTGSSGQSFYFTTEYNLDTKSIEVDHTANGIVDAIQMISATSATEGAVLLTFKPGVDLNPNCYILAEMTNSTQSQNELTSWNFNEGLLTNFNGVFGSSSAVKYSILKSRDVSIYNDNYIGDNLHVAENLFIKDDNYVQTIQNSNGDFDQTGSTPRYYPIAECHINANPTYPTRSCAAHATFEITAHHPGSAGPGGPSLMNHTIVGEVSICSTYDGSTYDFAEMLTITHSSYTDIANSPKAPLIERVFLVKSPNSATSTRYVLYIDVYNDLIYENDLVVKIKNNNVNFESGLLDQEQVNFFAGNTNFAVNDGILGSKIVRKEIIIPKANQSFAAINTDELLLTNNVVIDGSLTAPFIQGPVTISGDLYVSNIDASNIDATNIDATNIDASNAVIDNLTTTNFSFTGNLEPIYETYTFDTSNANVGDWITLAKIGNASSRNAIRADALFVLQDRLGSHHQALTFRAGQKFSSGVYINVLNNDWYSSQRFDKIKISYGGTYDGGVLQARVATSSTSLCYFRVYENTHYIGWNVDISGSPLADNSPVVYIDPGSSSGVGTPYSNNRTIDLTYDPDGGNRNAVTNINTTQFENYARFHTSNMVLTNTPFTMTGTGTFNVNNTGSTNPSDGIALQSNDGMLIQLNNSSGSANPGVFLINGNIWYFNTSGFDMNSKNVQNATLMTTDRIARHTGTTNVLYIGESSPGFLTGKKIVVEEPLQLYKTGSANNYLNSLNTTGNLIYTDNNITQWLALRRGLDPTWNAPTAQTNWALTSPYNFSFSCATSVRNGSPVTNKRLTATKSVLTHVSSDAHTLWDIASNTQNHIFIRRHIVPKDCLIRSVTASPWGLYCQINNSTGSSVVIDWEIWVAVEDGTSTGSSSTSSYSFNFSTSWSSTMVPTDVLNNNLSSSYARKVHVASRSVVNGGSSVYSPWISGSTTMTAATYDVNPPLYCPKGKHIGVYFVERRVTGISSGSVEFTTYAYGFGSGHAGAMMTSNVLCDMNMNS